MFRKFPYTNIHDLNLDWIVSKIKNVEKSEEAAASSAEEARGYADNALESAEAAQASAEASELSAQESESSAAALASIPGEIALLNARVDNLATLTEGSTTGDAELIDGRIASPIFCIVLP